MELHRIMLLFSGLNRPKLLAYAGFKAHRYRTKQAMITGILLTSGRSSKSCVGTKTTPVTQLSTYTDPVQPTVCCQSVDLFLDQGINGFRAASYRFMPLQNLPLLSLSRSKALLITFLSHQR